MITCDTSFLFALYGEDAHSRRATEWVADCGNQLSLTLLNVFELRNALLFSEFKRFYRKVDVARYRADFEAALGSDRLVLCRPNLAQVIEHASELAERYTASHGHRSFDVLHVAGAHLLAADVFLSFDQNQNKLAKRLKMDTPFMKSK